MTYLDQTIWAHDPDVYAGRIALKWPLDTWHWANVRAGYCTISIWQRPNEHTQVAQRIGPHGVSNASLVRIDHAVASGLVVPKKPLTQQEIETTTYIRYGRLYRLNNLVIEDPPPEASGRFSRYDLDDLSAPDHLLHVYRGQIIVELRDGWHLAKLAKRYVSICRIDQPNRHIAVYRWTSKGVVDPASRLSVENAVTGGVITLKQRLGTLDDPRVLDVVTDERIGECFRTHLRRIYGQPQREKLGMLLR